jgi:hypothetical protein
LPFRGFLIDIDLDAWFGSEDRRFDQQEVVIAVSLGAVLD